MNKYICLLITVVVLYTAVILGAASALDEISRSGGVQVADIAVKGLAESAEYQEKLLAEAGEIAGLIPVEPHIKDRSRAQARVVDTAIKLDLSGQAEKTTSEIANWRKNLCYGELAVYYARHAQADKAQAALTHAGEATGETQQWRDDEVLARIIRARMLLGKTGDEKAKMSGLTKEYQAMLADMGPADDESDWNKLTGQLDSMIGTGEFGVVRNSLLVYAGLLDRNYANIARREQVKAAIYKLWGPMPIVIRIEILTEMAHAAISAGDNAGAGEYIQGIQEYLDKNPWTTEDNIVLNARLAELRSECGDSQRAKEQAGRAWDKFASECKTIVNIYRAGVLCELAQVSLLTEGSQRALEIYKRALEESLDNPNSRPRAEDLVLICCSMAMHKVQPDEQLWQRIRDVKKGLSNPW